MPFTSWVQNLIGSTARASFPKSLDVSKAIDKAAGADREVVGTRTKSGMGSETTFAQDAWTQANRGLVELDVTAPATPEAERWSGFGTALKPAHEPIVVARKPLAGTRINVLETVESALRAQGAEGEIRWTSERASRCGETKQAGEFVINRSAASGGNICRACRRRRDAERRAANRERFRKEARESGATPTASTSRVSGESTRNPSESRSSMPTEASAPVAARESGSSSLSTISTAEGLPTEGQSTERSTSNYGARDSLLDTECFAGIATGLTGSWALVRIGRLNDGTFLWPDGLPRIVGGPTVAGNVLAHGTGALNIDGCRIAGIPPSVPQPDLSDVAGRATRLDARSRNGEMSEASGRWPANVVLSHSEGCMLVDERQTCVPGCAVRMLDEQSGVLTSGANPTRRGSDKFRTAYGEFAGQRECDAARGVDVGGAARFFYTAKASTAERGPDNKHPTVKPVDLMCWLVRLVTPPGGLVLDPFTGSGTTGIAALREGFSFIGLEREPEYVMLARRRIIDDAPLLNAAAEVAA